MKKIKVGIIGFGNIGKKRFKAIKDLRSKNIFIKYIVEKKKIKKIKNVAIYTNVDHIKNISVDLIIISLPTKFSKEVVKKLNGKFNLLVEKPLSINLNQVKNFVNKSKINNKVLKIGYNLRFDDGLLKAKSIFDQKKIGKINYVKISYANGAARTNSNEVGSMYDMGSHSLNLLQWFFDKSKFTVKKVLHQKNEYLNRSKIDNGFITLKIDNILCYLHHGFCNWNNIFKMEIYGSKGFLDVSSLSKWGNQVVSYGTRKYPSGVPKIKRYKFRIDYSWKNEIMFVIKLITSSSKNLKLKVNNEIISTLSLLKELQKNEKF